MGSAIEAEGGEILKFIGDGILAIFPTAEGEGADRRACRQALQAARTALQTFGALRAGFNDGKLAPACGIALHLGEVMYGNIGTADRLDFTVIGPAVNLVSRIEAFSRDLDPPVVCSAHFAAVSEAPFRSLGQHRLKGIREPQEIFALNEI